MRLPLLVAPAFRPHHVGSLISGRHSGWSISRLVATIPALPDVLGSQVKERGLLKSAGH